MPAIRKHFPFYSHVLSFLRNTLTRAQFNDNWLTIKTRIGLQLKITQRSIYLDNIFFLAKNYFSLKKLLFFLSITLGCVLHCWVPRLNSFYFSYLSKLFLPVPIYFSFYVTPWFFSHSFISPRFFLSFFLARNIHS